MASRFDLQAELEALLGSANVYFQPPENLKLSYPCIVYDQSYTTRAANNKKYIVNTKYEITHIYKKNSNDFHDAFFEAFEGRSCDFDRRFVSDNLYHDVYTLYY